MISLEFLITKIKELCKVAFHVIKSKGELWRLTLSAQGDIANFLAYLKREADPEIYQAAKDNFPWKFDMERNKTWYLDNLRAQQDPLVALFELRIPEADRFKTETVDHVNQLLAKTGTNLRLDTTSTSEIDTAS